VTGDGLVRPLNAPPAGSVQPGVQPGVSNAVVIAHLVVVYGAQGGIFVYSGTPANGNLIVSIAAGTGTDKYGNAYNGGVESYLPGGNESSSLYQASLGLVNGALSVSLSLTASGLLQLLGGRTDIALQIGMPLFVPLDAQYPGAAIGTVEPWHALPLINGWAAGSGLPPRYKLMVDNTVMFNGTLNGAAATSNVFADLSAGAGPAYTPVSLGQPFHVQSTSLAVGGQEYGVAGATGHPGFLVVESTVFTNSYVFDGRITLD
jgi:hypothetical protein